MNNNLGEKELMSSARPLSAINPFAIAIDRSRMDTNSVPSLTPPCAVVLTNVRVVVHDDILHA